MTAFDFYLSRLSGSPADQTRSMGNQIRSMQERLAAEWRAETDSFLPQSQEISGLPDGSWLLEIRFRLNKPFTSKSETEFHPYHENHEIQNPIVRDHVTGLPVVPPTTWKGHLSFAARAERLDGNVHSRLFGTTLERDAGRAGRLHFFPTFFTGKKPSREVITPLSRDTRTPSCGPIDFEVIPAGESGRFTLLYTPKPKGMAWSSSEITDDLEAAIHSVRAMLLDYGFSAKKTSGWGVVEESDAAGKLIAKGQAWPVDDAGSTHKVPFVEPQDTFRPFMDDRGRPIPELKTATGGWLSNQGYKAAGSGWGSLNEYKRFRAWYDAHGGEWMRRNSGQQTEAGVPLRIYEFSGITGLISLANRLAKSLREARSV